MLKERCSSFPLLQCCSDVSTGRERSSRRHPSTAVIALSTLAFFPSRWAMTALGSTAGLHSDKLGGDTLFGNDTTFHGTLFSTFSHADAMHRVLLAWGALGVLIVVLTIVICIGLKRKDVRV